MPPTTVDALLGDPAAHGDALRSLLSGLAVSTRASNAIPASDDGSYSYASTFPEFQQAAESSSARVSGLLRALHSHASVQGEDALALGAAGDDPDEAFAQLSELVEALLDEVDRHLGLDAGDSGAAAAGAALRGQVAALGEKLASRDVLSKRGQERPQMRPGWAPHGGAPTDNTPASFVPRPYDSRPVRTMTCPSGVAGEPDVVYYSHPFSLEIQSCAPTALQMRPPEAGNIPPPAGPPVAVSDVPGPDTYTLVDSKAALDAMTAALASEVELAVDVEHHSWRSFQGLTCLMQVTGRAGHDYLVDVLSPDVRPHVGQALGPLFTNPHVCKVLHGADSDVLWLQRDLGLYIVNLFDTYRAARRLAYPATSLGYLLTRLCGYDGSAAEKKQFQLSDWRERPLPAGMAAYARRDTHYLLHCYDKLRRELWTSLGAQSILEILDECKPVCMKRYEKELFRTNGYETLLKGPAGMAGPPLGKANSEALRRLWAWRDQAARAADESTGYVMSTQLMLKLARALPTTKAAVLAKGPTPAPAVLAAEADTIARIIASPAPAAAPAAAPAPAPAVVRPVAVPASSLAASDAAISELRASASPFTFIPAVSPAQDDGEPPAAAAPSAAAASARAAAAVAAKALPRMSAVQSPNLTGRGGVQAPSPVLNTEELYRTAGWMTPKNAAQPQGVALAPANTGLDASRPLSHTLRFGAESPAAGGGRSAGDGADEQRSTAADGGKGGAGAGSGSGSGSEAAAAGGGGKAGGHSSAFTADPKYAAMAHHVREEIKNESAEALWSTPFEADEAFGDDLTAVVAAPSEHTDASVDSRSRAIAAGVSPRTHDAASDDNAGDDGGAVVLSGQGSSEDDDDNDDDSIPRSMAEIYKISNRNRKRNKEKKKRRASVGDAADDGSAAPADGDNDGDADAASAAADSEDDADMTDAMQEYFSGRKRQKAGADEALEFMSSIGWVNPADSAEMTRAASSMYGEGHSVARPAAAAAAAGLNGPSDSYRPAAYRDGPGGYAGRRDGGRDRRTRVQGPPGRGYPSHGAPPGPGPSDRYRGGEGYQRR